MRAEVPALLVLGLAACTSPSKKESVVMSQAHDATDDERLVGRVRVAVAAHAAPDGLVAQVEQAPLVDTRAGVSLAALRRVDFQVDPDHPGEPLVLGTAQVVIYWQRPVPSPDPRVVGVQYQGDGSAAVFFAVIPPP